MHFVSEPNIVLLESGDPKNITSLFYPERYPNNAYKLWEVQAPDGFGISIVVLLFLLETGRDYVYIRDGVGGFTNTDARWKSWTGHVTNKAMLSSMNLYSNSTSVTLIFTSDHSTTKQGFVIQVKIVRKANTEANGK